MDEAKYPFVSVCTPTYNRRKHIPGLIQCYLRQDYPKSRMEWIIVDDGTEKVGDLVRNVPGVRYFSYNQKIPIGRKRNLTHEKSKGDIIVYMDDDDYYPKERVSHAVEMLMDNPRALCAGSSEMHIYFKSTGKIYQFGPYGPRHATGGTLAFRRILLNFTAFDNKAEKSEESKFLRGFSIPMVQLDTLKSILVIAHDSNTVDKHHALSNKKRFGVRDSVFSIENFIPDSKMRDMFTK